MCGEEIMKELVSSSNPILLEPVMNVEISAPHGSVKDVVNDIIGMRRGRV